MRCLLVFFHTKSVNPGVCLTLQAPLVVQNSHISSVHSVVAPGSWPLDSAVLIPPSWLQFQVSLPPTHTCRIPSQCVFIRGKVLCKLIVRWGTTTTFLSSMYLGSQGTHRDKAAGGHRIWGDRQPVPLVFPNLDGEPTHPGEREGGAGGGVLFLFLRMLQPPGCNSCFNFVKSKLSLLGMPAHSFTHNTHLWSGFGCLRHNVKMLNTVRKAAGLLREYWWVRLVKQANSPYEALQTKLQRLLVGTQPGQGTGNTKFKEGWDPAGDQGCVTGSQDV